MKNRIKRQLAIRKIISNEGVGSQEELLHKLKKEGFDLTQATLSRDLKILRVVKVPNKQGGYKYVISEENITEQHTERNRINYLADGFLGIDFSGNLAVAKTFPGYASSIASIIDKENPFEILGTIAGDDTILIVKREGISNNDLINSLILIMPNLEDKIG